MFAIFKIAIRNVFAHKVKTMIVGSLIFLGIFLMVLGNSFLDSTSKGIQRAYSNSVTGDIAVLKNIDFDFSLFGTWNNIGNLSVPVVPDLENTLEFLKTHPEVDVFTTVSSNMLMVNTGELSPDLWIMGMAVDPESYTSIFDIKDTIILHEGRFLEPGEEGIVLSSAVVEYLMEYKDIEVHPGDSLLLNGYSANGFRIREVPIRGIFEYNYVKGDMYPMLPRTCFIDQQNFNVLNGIVVKQEQTPPPPELEEMLFNDSMDDLFSETIEIGTTADQVETNLDSLLGDMSVRHELSKVNNFDWQWLLLSLKNSDDSSVKTFRADLENHFKQSFSTFEEKYILKPIKIAQTLLEPNTPEFAYIAGLLTLEEKNSLSDSLSIMDEDALSSTIVSIFTSFLDKDELYEKEAFKKIHFSSITNNLVKKTQKDYELIRRNRLILEELYPYALSPGPDYMVSEWWHAASPMSTTTTAIQASMNFALIIIFIVVIIIIMNTLMISVMERTGEIGTLRAIGGQKSFIFYLFITETMTISLIFGTLGMIVGSLVITILGNIGIPAADGSFLQMIAGGNSINPSLSAWTIGFSLLFMFVVGVLSSLYPVFYAMKIQPVEAMREE
ncbi:MAG: FtsX-like permease family protein [Spirochaetaceae bacterium]